MINNRGGNPTLRKPISNTQVQCCIFSSILFNMLSLALHFSKNSIRLTNQSATIELYSAVKDQNWLSVLAFSRLTGLMLVKKMETNLHWWLYTYIVQYIYFSDINSIYFSIYFFWYLSGNVFTSFAVCGNLSCFVKWMCHWLNVLFACSPQILWTAVTPRKLLPWFNLCLTWRNPSPEFFCWCYCIGWFQNSWDVNDLASDFVSMLVCV